MDLLHEAFKGKRIVLAGMGKGQGTVTAKLLLSLELRYMHYPDRERALNQEMKIFTP